MTPVIAQVLVNLKEDNEYLRKEVAELKRELQFRHTTISDLRYSKRQMAQALSNQRS